MNRLAIGGVVVGILLAACGGGDGGPGFSGKPINPGPPPGSYDLRAAMAALEANGSSTPVSLSGTVIGGASSFSFTGTGTWALSPGTNGTFNGAIARLQTVTLSGNITVGGTSRPYSSSAENAYDGGTGAILGGSRSGEIDVASAPIMIPSSVGTTPTILGTLSRYADSTLSVVLGTTQISVAVALNPVDPGTTEVVRFTFNSYDTSGTLVETDTQSYYLTEQSVLSFYGATASNASGSLSVVAQVSSSP